MPESPSDESTAPLTAGREAVVAVFVTLRSKLRLVFISFLFGFLASFGLLRGLVWPQLKENLIIEGAKVVAVTPFDVILLQTKMSLFFGVLIGLIHLFYLSRGAVGNLEWVQTSSISRGMQAGVALGAMVLFAGGIAYAYYIIFPLLFRFLQMNAIGAGFQPTYSIVDWTEFILILSVVMGFAAELPLLMSLLTYLRTVQYETFRDYWRHAVLAIVIVAAMVNGSPEPFSMMLIAVPLIVLYGIGLACSRGVSGMQNTTANQSDPQTPPQTDESRGDTTEGDGEGMEKIVQRRTAGAVNAFADDEVQTEQIGGYIYDIKYILASLKGHLIYLFAFFMLVAGIAFTALYNGGIELLKEDFLAKLPASVPEEQLDIVLLHPIEVLVVEMKVGAIVAVILCLPYLLYAIAPALQERGITTGERPKLLKWLLGTLIALAVGSATGYAFIAPTIVSYLVTDTVTAGVDIAYRVSDFFWLVFFTTVGIGLLAIVPSIMMLAHIDDVVSYETMRERWRVPVFISFAAPVFLPQGVIMMLIVGFPLAISYAVGLACTRAIKAFDSLARWND